VLRPMTVVATGGASQPSRHHACAPCTSSMERPHPDPLACMPRKRVVFRRNTTAVQFYSVNTFKPCRATPISSDRHPLSPSPCDKLHWLDIQQGNCFRKVRHRRSPPKVQRRGPTHIVNTYITVTLTAKVHRSHGAHGPHFCCSRSSAPQVHRSEKSRLWHHHLSRTCTAHQQSSYITRSSFDQDQLGHHPTLHCISSIVCSPSQAHKHTSLAALALWTHNTFGQVPVFAGFCSVHCSRIVSQAHITRSAQGIQRVITQKNLHGAAGGSSQTCQSRGTLVFHVRRVKDTLGFDG
jgi:hypothetical protein